MNRTLKFTLQITAAVGALAIMPPVTAGKACKPPTRAAARLNYFCQQPPTSGESDKDRMENERDLEFRVWNLRALSERRRQPERKRPNVQQALKEMQKDFTRLQIVNKDLLRVALGNGPLDPRFVLKSVTEINERAERLNKNLALPEADKTAEHPRPILPTGADHLKRSLMRLGRLIFNFVDNPFFKEISVIDTPQTMRARRDLEEIIEVSGQIKKRNEKTN